MADGNCSHAAPPQLCAAGAHVVWTRHRRDPDLTPRIGGWFDNHGFEEDAFAAPADGLWSVGVHRFAGSPNPLDTDLPALHLHQVRRVS